MLDLHALGAQMLTPKYIGWLFNGLQMTLFVTVITAIVATLLGFLLAAARSSSLRLLSWPATAYIALFRNTPLLVQLLFWYFGFPSLFPEGTMEWLNAVHRIHLFGIIPLTWPSFEFVAAVFGLILYSTAYVSEEIRAGMRGVAGSQGLAAAALGLTRWQSLRYIVLPQAVRIATPALLGQYMNILKNTSLTMGVGLVELSYTSRQVEAETFKTFQAFGIATLMYITAIAVMEVVGQYLLRRRARQGH